MILLIIIVEILAIGLIFSILGYKSFKAWKKYREESLIHITLFFFAFATLIPLISLWGLPTNFELDPSSKEVKILFDLIYNLVYLEISIFYLSIFTNARTHFESYAPFFVGVSTILTLIAGISAEAIYEELSLFFHIISLIIILILLYLGLKHLKNSKKYLKSEKEVKFLDYVIKILSIAPVFLILDSFTFFLYIIDPDPAIIYYTQETLLIVFTLGLGFVILIYLFCMNMVNRLEHIDLVELLNTIS